jgi:hypothetical protein
METATGPDARTRVPVLIRVAILGITVAAVVTAFATYVPGDIGRVYPPASLISHTWYGPALLILVPLELAWLFAAIKPTWLKILALGVSVLLLLACLAFVYGIKERSGTLPLILMRGHML